MTYLSLGHCYNICPSLRHWNSLHPPLWHCYRLTYTETLLQSLSFTETLLQSLSITETLLQSIIHWDTVTVPVLHWDTVSLCPSPFTGTMLHYLSFSYSLCPSLEHCYRLCPFSPCPFLDTDRLSIALPGKMEQSVAVVMLVTGQSVRNSGFTLLSEDNKAERSPGITSTEDNKHGDRQGAWKSRQYLLNYHPLTLPLGQACVSPFSLLTLWLCMYCWRVCVFICMSMCV